MNETRSPLKSIVVSSPPVALRWSNTPLSVHNYGSLQVGGGGRRLTWKIIHRGISDSYGLGFVIRWDLDCFEIAGGGIKLVRVKVYQLPLIFFWNCRIRWFVDVRLEGGVPVRNTDLLLPASAMIIFLSIASCLVRPLHATYTFPPAGWLSWFPPTIKMEFDYR